MGEKTGGGEAALERYATAAMREVFSAAGRARVWRRLWVGLAEAQAELGLPITPAQLEALRRAAAQAVDLAAVARYEKRLRHDVMAHLHAFGDAAPEARGVLHLGATSAFITDNADQLLLRQGLRLVGSRLGDAGRRLAAFARRWRDLPVLAYTHLQPAQPTTAGKRACLWLQNFLLDLEELERRLAAFRFRGVRDTTGTQASFLNLFGGDAGKVAELERRVAAKLELEPTCWLTGQVYPRKLDSQLLAFLSGVAQSAAQLANDVRFLQHTGELEEPFEEEQVGSSAMPHKRNPMRCERINALARLVICAEANGPATAAAQFLERTLDDSANRRVILPQAFLLTDGLLNLAANVAGGLRVYPAVARANLERELPFLAAERLLMTAAAAGGDRQELHERLRRHAMAARVRQREEGAAPDLLERLRADEAFAAVAGSLGRLLDPAAFVGLAPRQVDEFLDQVAEPLLARWPAASGGEAAVEV